MEPGRLPGAGGLAENGLERLMKLGQQKIVVSAHIAVDFPGKGSIAVDVDGPLLDRRPAWPRAPGLWWCKHRDRRGANPEDEDDGQQTNQ
jgi:hypothetical protein